MGAVELKMEEGGEGKKVKKRTRRRTGAGGTRTREGHGRGVSATVNSATAAQGGSGSYACDRPPSRLPGLEHSKAPAGRELAVMRG